MISFSAPLAVPAGRQVCGQLGVTIAGDVLFAATALRRALLVLVTVVALPPADTTKSEPRLRSRS